MKYIIFVREQDIAQVGPWILGERKDLALRLMKPFGMKKWRIISGQEDRMVRTARAIGRAVDVTPSEHAELTREEGVAFDAKKALQIVKGSGDADVLVIVTNLANIRGVLKSLMTRVQRIYYPRTGDALIFNCATQALTSLESVQVYP